MGCIDQWLTDALIVLLRVRRLLTHLYQGRRARWQVFFFFFFQAEDGIRDWSVTGVQTCSSDLLVGCASLHRTVGRLRTLPWDAEARAPPLRDSTVTGSSTPPYHTPSSELVAGTTVAGSVAG